MPVRPGARITRRRVLAGLLLVPPALSACAAPVEPSGPDPLIALADGARADAALGVAAVTAAPDLAERVQPLIDARAEHARALDAEVARLAAVGAAPTAPVRAPAPAATPDDPTLARLRAAAEAAAAAASAAALELPADRVGLVASVAACCGTYAAVLT